MNWINRIIDGLGGSSASSDVLLVAGAIVGLLVLAIFCKMSLERAKLPEDTERIVSTLSHKITKIETEVYSRRTEQTRVLDILKAELEFLREEIKELRVQLGVLPTTGPLSARRVPSQTPVPTINQNNEVVDTFISPEQAVQRARDSGSGVHHIPDIGPPPSFAVTGGVDEADWKTTPAFTKSGKPTLDFGAPTLDLARPKSLAEKLTKSRKGLFSKIRGLFSSSATLDPRLLDNLEETLLGADLGVHSVTRLMDELRAEMSHGKVYGEEELVHKIKTKLLTIMDEPVTELRAVKLPDSPLIVMVVGVNGVGKTTTCAKLASRWKAEGKNVLLVAADTFRAAAVDQLMVWAQRLGIEVISGPENTKPQTVVYDAMSKAKSGKYDVVLIDTAGRLHNKANLMQELEGVKNAVAKHFKGAPHEILLVVDGTTGQNALNQAREFHTATPITGLIVTKLDGTAKGGIVVAIKDELSIPVRFIGVGEGEMDLRTFNSQEFVEALLNGSGLPLEEEAAQASA